MARSKLYLGTINVNGLRLGTEDIKMFRGDDKKYPLCDASSSYTASESSASNVESNATANTVSWSYTCVTTDNNCLTSTTYGEASSSVTFTQNETSSPRTINGNISWNGISIPYSFTQNGQGTYTPPTAKNLTYNGQSQELLNNGTTSFGTLQYSSDGGTTWSTSVPSGTNAGTYTLKWRILGDATHEGVPEETIIAEIAKATPTVTAPTVKTNLTYNGSAQTLVNDGSTDFGTLQYSLDGVDYSTALPSGTNATNYTIYYKVVGDSNINDVAPTTITTEIAKADGNVTTPPTAKLLTYNGSAQALVTEGVGTTTMLYKLDDGSWDTTLPSGTNVTSYTVYYKTSATTNYTESSSGSVEVTISKVTPTVTAPIAKSNLTYNGSAQALVDEGSTDFGTLQYSLDGVNYSTAVPSGTNASSYTIYYKVVGDGNINDVAATSIGNEIAKANPTYIAPTSKTGLIYDGTAKELLNSGSTSDGTMQYSPDNTNWSTDIPSGTNVNSYTSYWRIIGDTNHNDKASESIVTTIADGSGRVIVPPTPKSGLVYNASGQELVTEGTGTGTMLYKVGDDDWSTEIPSGTNATSYTVYYKASASTEYGESESGSVEVSIAKVTPTVTAPTPETLTYNASAQTLANAGNTDYGTLVYSLDDVTYSTTIPTATNANVTYTVYYKVSGDSNVNSTTAETISCSIAEKRVTTPTITLDPTSYTYDGEECEPSATVKDGTQVIDPTEYTVTYENNINAGTATVVISDNALGNYYISGTTTFSINQASGSVTTVPTAKSLTYNGSAQALVTAGASDTGTMLYRLNDGEWGTSIPTATNATSYTVYYKASASTNYTESTSGSVEVTIAKITPTVTAPTAKSLTYNGSAQALVNAGSTDYGTLYYSLDGSNYSTSIPSGTNATSYTVYYRVTGNANVNDVAATIVTASIAKADACYETAPTAKSLTYNGSSQTLLNGGSSSCGTIQYSSNNSSWSATIPSGTNAGTYTSYWRIIGDSNHNDKASTSISTTIAKASGSVTTAPTAKSGLVYNGSSQALVNAGSGTGTMLYKLGSGSWGTSIPSTVNAGTYTVYYKASATTNYNESSSGSVSVSVSKISTCVSIPNWEWSGYPGDTHTFTANTSSCMSPTSWSSTNTSVATVDSNGKVTIVGVGEATIYAYYDGSTNYASSSDYARVTGNCVSCSISSWPSARNPTYNGSSQALIYAGSAYNGCTMYYSLDGSSWSTSVPTATNVGTYTVYYMADSSEYCASSTYTINASILCRQASVSSSPSARNPTYNGSSQALIYGGSGRYGTMYYKLGSGSWSTSIPSATSINDYTVYYKVVATAATYCDSDEYSLTASILCRQASVSSAPTATNPTYNGSAQALVTKGSANYGTMRYSLNGGSWSTSVPSATSVGSYTVSYKVVATATSYCDSDAVGVYAQILCRQASVSSAPSALNPTYNGSSQALVTKGTASNGTMQYSLNGSSWSTSVPSATSVGDYTVYYKVVGSGTYCDSQEYSIGASILCRQASVSSAPTPINPTYNGYPRFIVTKGSANYGNMQYKIDSGSWSTAQPSATAVGTYRVYYKVKATASTYCDSNEYSVDASILCRPLPISPPTPLNPTYNGYAQALVSPGSAGSSGTMYYKLGSGSWSTSVPTASAVNTYTVYYKAIATDSTYCSESDVDSVTCSIVCRQATVSTAPTAINPTYNGSSQILVFVGSASNGVMVYRLSSGSWSTTRPSATAIGTYTVYYKASATTAGYCDSDVYSVEASILCTQATVALVPAAANPTYNGSAQVLVLPGTANNGTMVYSLNAVSWSTTRPSATAVGTYTVYYKVSATTAGYCDSEVYSVTSTISTQTTTELTWSFSTANYNLVITYHTSVDSHSQEVTLLPGGEETLDLGIPTTSSWMIYLESVTAIRTTSPDAGITFEFPSTGRTLYPTDKRLGGTGSGTISCSLSSSGTNPTYAGIQFNPV